MWEATQAGTISSHVTLVTSGLQHRDLHKYCDFTWQCLGPNKRKFTPARYHHTTLTERTVTESLVPHVPYQVSVAVFMETLSPVSIPVIRWARKMAPGFTFWWEFHQIKKGYLIVLEWCLKAFYPSCWWWRDSCTVVMEKIDHIIPNKRQMKSRAVFKLHMLTSWEKDTQNTMKSQWGLHLGTK
jgi:hypothetical protein